MKPWGYLLGALVAGGCYVSTGPDADAGSDRDAPRGVCDPIGTLESCHEACGGHRACNSLEPMATYSCQEDLCLQVREPYVPGRDEMALRCSLPFGDPPFRDWSHRGDHACLLVDALSPPPVESVGITISEADCDALRAARGVDCYWSDGSIRTRTPPPAHATCPAPPMPGSVLCGGPCGDCDYVRAGNIENFDVPCLGRNDEREFGVCGFVSGGSGCSPETPVSSLCDADAMRDDWSPLRCACLSFLREDGFERAGWVVPEGNCTTYRALYPGQVECYDDAWEPVP